MTLKEKVEIEKKSKGKKVILTCENSNFSCIEVKDLPEIKSLQNRIDKQQEMIDLLLKYVTKSKGGKK